MNTAVFECLWPQSGGGLAIPAADKKRIAQSAARPISTLPPQDKIHE